MPTVKFNTALIVGAGSGLSAALARVLATEGIKVALAARSTGDLDDLAKEIGAQTFTCDASKRADVEKLFADLDGGFGAPEIVIYNPSYRTRGPIAELDPAEVEKALMVSAFGGFLVGQQAVKRMLPKKHGCIVFTGASASVKGYAQSAPFAMGKFALRGLAQSMSRELHPQGHPRRAHHDRRRHQERAAAGAGRQDREPAQSRTRSPRAICTSSISRTAPGPRRWNAALGRNVLSGCRRTELPEPALRGRFLLCTEKPEEMTMRKMLLTMTAVAALAALPTIASADPDAAGNAAAGAAVGAGVGFAVGGPVGAAVGAGVGGTVGAGAPQSRDRDEVVIERGRAPVRERNCTRDSCGNAYARKSGAKAVLADKKEAPLRRGFFLCDARARNKPPQLSLI